jgi:hypothetical protein
MQLVAYLPTLLALVSVVVQTGWAVRLAAVSPPTNVAKAGVICGTALPYTVPGLLAVMVSGTAATVSLAVVDTAVKSEQVVQPAPPGVNVAARV